MDRIIDIPEKIEEYIKDYIPIGAGNNVFCYPDEIVKMLQNGAPIPEHGRLIDADALIKVVETMYLEGDSPLSFRVDGNTEDTLIGKFQMIDTISDAPTILEADMVEPQEGSDKE